jgi:hypothetical protein
MNDHPASLGMTYGQDVEPILATVNFAVQNYRYKSITTQFADNSRLALIHSLAENSSTTTGRTSAHALIRRESSIS